MKTFTVPSKEQLSPGSQAIVEQVKKRIGKVPNLYAMIGSSAVALQAFLDFDAAFSKGVFTAKEREVIALATSEVNGCGYCLAAHTGTALKNGLTLEDTLAIRKGNIADERLNAITQLVKSIVENNGHPQAGLLDNFYTAGYGDDAMMELIGLVAVRIFTNYVYAVTDIPIDFPAAAAI